jgi:formylglycine-generating enzyme required for sulfatase activity
VNPRRHSWRDEAGEHELVLVEVPAANGDAFPIGEGAPVDVPGFFIATTPVTQALWQHVMGANPSVRRELGCPVENVSWDQIRGRGGFLDRINASEVREAVAAGDDRLRFRLPTEAEWEYAARGGPRWRDGFRFSGSNDPDAVAWYGPRWRRGHQWLVHTFGWPLGWRLANTVVWGRHGTLTHPVASKAPNQLGLYDMSGNVWEWCEDACGEDGSERRLRGGCHHNWDLHCTVWWRYGIDPSFHDGCIGFRLALANVV